MNSGQAEACPARFFLTFLLKAGGALGILPPIVKLLTFRHRDRWFAPFLYRP
jgi:hypothetical protein